MRLLATLLVALVASGCASQKKRDLDPLPFHVAVLPVDVDVPPTVAEVEDGKEVEVTLAFDADEISNALTNALHGQCFSKATLLSADSAEASEQEYLGAAHAIGADLILDARLEYQERISTELNDKFWLNLPLFLLGGPATWFVNDRSYYFDVKLEVVLYDVTAALNSETRELDADSRVVRIDRESREAHLDFLDRADGAGSYGLSILIPSGFVAKETDAVPDELKVEITEQLCDSLTVAIHDRAVDVTRPDLVSFHPENVALAEESEGRVLSGDVVLRLGDVTDLQACRYRVNGGEFIEASFGEEAVDIGRGEKRYPFRIELGEGQTGTIQLEIEQGDRQARTRTFTYTVPTGESK